jgi:ADP-ribose pyrophosphatase
MAPLADKPVSTKLAPAVPIGAGRFAYERITATVDRPGAAPLQLTRDVLRAGAVAAVLPFDPRHDEIVLLRQFRLPAHLALGAGEIVEIVAGRVEQGEDVAETARRECIEEIGVEPRALKKLMTYLSTPGLTDETVTLFVGIVDASTVPERAGAADEQEETRPVRTSVDAALAALESGKLHNANIIIALQWLALNRHRLDEFIAAATAR